MKGQGGSELQVVPSVPIDCVCDFDACYQCLLVLFSSSRYKAAVNVSEEQYTRIKGQPSVQTSNVDLSNDRALHKKRYEIECALYRLKVSVCRGAS